MSYETHLSPRAIGKLRSIPAELLGQVRDEMERLAGDPKKHGRKIVSPPYPATIENLFFFKLRRDEQLHYVTVFFLYCEDCRLFVTNITIDPPFSDAP